MLEVGNKYPSLIVPHHKYMICFTHYTQVSCTTTSCFAGSIWTSWRPVYHEKNSFGDPFKPGLLRCQIYSVLERGRKSKKNGLGRRGRNQRRGHNQRHFGLSCVRLVYFLCKSTEFHAMCTECQIILFSLLLIISHRRPEFAKHCPILFTLLIFLLDTLSMCYSVNGLHKE